MYPARKQACSLSISHRHTQSLLSKCIKPHFNFMSIHHQSCNLRDSLRISLCDMELSKIHSHQELQLPSKWQLQNVEKLQLTNCWRPGLLKQKSHGVFQKIKVPKVYYHRLSTLFSYSVFGNL